MSHDSGLESEPKLLIEQAAIKHGGCSGGWLVAWNVQNLCPEGVQILTGRLPHSKFRSEEKKFTPIPRLSLGESAKIEFMVRCSEPPGTVIENAFLILRILWLEAPWWVFARLRVTLDDGGAPQTVTELMTTQRAGFSGV